jgi:hypothetical protein
MVRTLLRGVLLRIKGALLAVAVAAIVLWIWSYRHPGRVELYRWTGWWGAPGSSGSVNQTWMAVGYGRGRMGVAWDWREYSGYQWGGARQQLERGGPDWMLETRLGPDLWYTMEGRAAWGPFRLRLSDDWDSGYAKIFLRGFSVRCWAVVAAAGAWPLASLVLYLRRRQRANRLARAGHCHRCGYDLRATPDRCPECGSPSDFAARAAVEL